MEKILKLLEDDATLTCEQIALMLQKEVGEIKDAIKKYEKDGVILGYKTLIDWDKTDREYVSAIIEVKVLPQRDRGFDKIAELFDGVAAIEKEHEERYRKLLANVKGDLVFSKDGDAVWQCSNCGHIVVGKKAPEVCPICAHPQAYFQVRAENY